MNKNNENYIKWTNNGSNNNIKGYPVYILSTFQIKDLDSYIDKKSCYWMAYEDKEELKFFKHKNRKDCKFCQNI